jgi:peptidoglycan/xylan/chitin deacetylase (PgdA/CDA1 family)
VPTLCLRFDVDSHRCLAEGVPALLDLLDDHDVPATFYVNMGRVTSRSRMARRLVERRLGRVHNSDGEDAPKATLPLSTKLGRDGSCSPTPGSGPRCRGPSPRSPGAATRWACTAAARTACGRTTPATGAARSWRPRSAGAWAGWRPRGCPHPAGFSSPGWNGSPLVARVAADHGFRYLADDHGHGPAPVARGPEGLVRVSTNLVGEPGGVGYLEWHRALGHGDDDILRDVAERLGDSGDLAVLYDHPFYAGVFELDLLGRVIEQARSSGWELDTIGNVAARAA